MMVPKHTKAWLILGLVFFFLCATIPVFYTAFYHEITSVPTAIDGQVDLSSVTNDNRIILDGKWDFYWNRLLVTDSLKDARADLQIQVPDYWSKYKVNDNFLPASGYASYKLVVNGLHTTSPVTVYIPDFGSAYRVFLNGKLTAESGIISSETSKINTTPIVKLYPVTVSADKPCEVVIEVATTRFSGLYMAPSLQDYNQATSGIDHCSNMRFFLFGIILFSLIILSIVYGYSLQKGLRFRWLPFLITCILLRLLLTTQLFGFLQHTIFFQFSYEAVNEILFLATFMLNFLLIFLFQEQFGIVFSKKEKLLFLIYYAALYFAHVFIPYGLYNRHLTFILPAASFLLEIYSFFKVYFSRHPFEKHVFPIYLGTLVAISGLCMDCYYANGNSYVNLSLALTIALAIDLMILSFVYILRIAALYNEVAVSAASLANARSQIGMQAQYYEDLSKRINEIRAVRHDMHHFTNVLKQLSDGKHNNELNQFLNSYVEKADTEPLPVFCDNVVANSILGYYSLVAAEQQIRFSCACAISKELTVRDTDLCTLLSNSLENAMEACKKLGITDDRYILVEARNHNGQLLIKIENSYNGCITTHDGNYLTNKSGDFHGMGIKNMRKVVQLSNGYLKIQHDDNVFTLMAAFPNP
jgi:hypothetical protein